jgi:uncharacterized repeat protein (TIGR03803 family)
MEGGSSPSLEVVYAFTGAGGLPVGSLARSADGTLYGATQYGGLFAGSVFALVPDGAGGFRYQELHAFQGPDGAQPLAGLFLGSDGNLYGTTGFEGGSGGNGTVFRMDLAGDVTTLHVFTGPDGAQPHGSLIQGADGNFYGTTSRGGTSNLGTVYRVDGAGNFVSLHSFSGSDGAKPWGSLYRDAGGNLYGSTSEGGANNVGVLFKLDSNGALTVLHSFSYDPSDGVAPASGLVLGPDGNLYGTAAGGGFYGDGLIYRLVLPNTFEAVRSLQGSSDGSGPISELADAGDGTLIGTAVEGGPTNNGTVFRVSPSGAFSVLHTFVGTDGTAPSASVTVDPAGNLYSSASFGGPYYTGLLFQIDSSGTESTLHAFVPEGVSPYGPLLQGSDGMLYGTTLSSPTGWGSVFQLAPWSNPTMFVSFRDGINIEPFGGVAESADGWFYGTTTGLPDNLGSVFRVKVDGTLETLHDMTVGAVSRPYAGLLHASDGNYYGTAHEGAQGVGAVFRIDSANAFSVLHGFDIFTEGGSPCGRLIEASPGVFTGTNEGGGLNGAGTVFQIDTNGNTTVLFGFVDSPGPQPDGKYPCSDIALGSDGNFYGTTLFGGSADSGTAFKLSPGGVLTTLHAFQGPDGASPLAGLAEAPDGSFYGTTNVGGAANLGTLFRIDSAGRFTNLYSFDGLTGANPTATLTLATDGFLYGTATEGGWFFGTVFRISAGIPAASVSPTSGPADSGNAITISGVHFDAAATVAVGGVAATGVNISSLTTATATTPTLTPGTLNHVLLLNPDHSSTTVIEGWLADFLDVPQGDLFHPYVENLFRNHITAGIGAGYYGRDDAVSRSQMAVLLLKSEHGSGYVPPPCVGLFGDVPCPGSFTDWIEQLYNEGITGGCGGGNYCPNAPVTRAQMAVFLLKAEHGSSYVPPVCSGVFSDVECSPIPAFAVDWIEELYHEAITGGCGGGNYCPGSPNTRGQMAVFLVKTFQLQ